MSYDDDIYLGESVRGLSSGPALMGMNTEIGAAQSPALRQMAQARFGQHAPLNKVLRSPYKDGTQIAIKATGTILSTAFDNTDILPTVTGATRLFQSFKPEKAIASEVLIGTYTNGSDVTAKSATAVVDLGDIVLVQAYSGSLNCFPNAPNESNGIPGTAFRADSLGNGISWPTLNTGVDMSITWAVEESVLYRLTPPTGYTQADLVSVKVIIRLALFGPSLR